MLGVDPGTQITGWGIVDERGSKLSYVRSGVIRARGERARRLSRIFEEIVAMCAEFAPDVLVLEKSFVGSNVQTAFRLGEARGVVMVAAARAGLPVVEYSPAEIKIAVTGTGRALKEQVQIMTARLLGIELVRAADEADALAAALCHTYRRRFVALTANSAARRHSLAAARRAWAARAGIGR